MTGKDLLACINRWYICAPRRKTDKEAMDKLQAILAALEGPSEEEIKDLSDVFDYLVYHAGKHMTWDKKIQGFIDKIRTLIQGNPAPGKEAADGKGKD